AECDQQFPPSDGDCHTPLPCEVRKWNDTTPRACSLHVQEEQECRRRRGTLRIGGRPCRRTERRHYNRRRGSNGGYFFAALTGSLTFSRVANSMFQSSPFTLSTLRI